MIIKNNKIVECTEKELFDYYISRELDLLYPFNEYKDSITNKGTRIIEENNEF